LAVKALTLVVAGLELLVWCRSLIYLPLRKVI